MPCSQVQVLSPHEAALRIAGALYAGENESTTDTRTFDLAEFQADAVRRARKILGARGGVLIADSVGLGKTYIALALIEEELDGGGRVLVATPAALRRLWRAPLLRLAQAHGVVATGLGGGPGAGATPANDSTVRRAPSGTALMWVSHARLSRGISPGFNDHAASGPTLVVVDEAHAFRNPRTRRYREIARLCLGARVVLLTATPVNNTLLDLYSLIRMFAADTCFRDLGVEDLHALFRAAALRPDAQPAPAMLAVLRAIMIRRTRPILRESQSASSPIPHESRGSCPIVREPQSSSAQRRAGRQRAPASNSVPAGIRFPERAPPRVLRYDLEASVPNLIDDVAACLEALTFAPFRIPAYCPRHTTLHPSGAAELIRMMMLKRLESSVAALRSSIDAQIAFIESFIEHLESGRLLRPADQRATRRASDGTAVQLLLGGVALDPLPRRIDERALETDAAADLERLRTLRDRLPCHVAAGDAKLGRLCELIYGELAGERVLVFTEFRETARYLWTALRDRGGTALIHGGGAFLGRARCGRREVVDRFAPAANGAVAPPPREAVRILIATDVLSEGMNLQDARHVVSYDLPWNPVRLIQRIGRIDRLGSPHDVVRAHVFIPQRGLDRLIGLLERIRIKLAAIHGGVGTETCMPREFAAPAFVDRLARGDPRILDEIERHDAAPFEAEERLRSTYHRVRPRPAEPADTVTPVLAVHHLTSPPPDSTAMAVLLAVRTGDSVRLALRTAPGQLLLDPPAAFETLTTLVDEVHRPMASPAAPALEPDREAIADALRALRRLIEKRADGAGDPSHSKQQRRRTPGHKLSRLLLGALARVPGGPDARLCARAENLLAMLARGGTAGLEHAFASLRGPAAAPESAIALCDALDALFRASQPRDARTTAAAAPAPGAIELIGAIELRHERVRTPFAEHH